MASSSPFSNSYCFVEELRIVCVGVHEDAVSQSAGEMWGCSSCPPAQKRRPATWKQSGGACLGCCLRSFMRRVTYEPLCPVRAGKSNHSTPTSSQNWENAAVMMQSSGITRQTSDALGPSEQAKGAAVIFFKTYMYIMLHRKLVCVWVGWVWLGLIY